MLGYFDTSAIVPLLIDEPATRVCQRFWDDADDVVTCRIAYAEVAAALAQASRLDRISRPQYASAMAAFETLWLQFDVIDVDEGLVHEAGSCAWRFGLRGYDSVHCAAAVELRDDDLVAAAGDRVLLEAWRGRGIATYDVNN